MKDCMCDGWRRSMNEITNGQTILKLIKGIDYTGEVFKFCPWCGQELNGECTGCEHNLGPSIDCGIPSLTPCPRMDSPSI